MESKDSTIEEIEPFPLNPLPVEKRGQEPKIEETKTFELTDSEQKLIIYSLHQVMNEGSAVMDESVEALIKKLKGEE